MLDLFILASGLLAGFKAVKVLFLLHICVTNDLKVASYELSARLPCTYPNGLQIAHTERSIPLTSLCSARGGIQDPTNSSPKILIIVQVISAGMPRNQELLAREVGVHYSPGCAADRVQLELSAGSDRTPGLCSPWPETPHWAAMPCAWNCSSRR